MGADDERDLDPAFQGQEAHAIAAREGHDPLVVGDRGVRLEVDPPGLVPLEGIAGRLDGELSHLTGEPEVLADFAVAEPAEVEDVGGAMAEGDAGHEVGGAVEVLHGDPEPGGVFRGGP